MDIMPRQAESAFGGKKILILYTSVGWGHKSLAQNIGWHLMAAGFEVKLADIAQLQGGKFERMVVGIHQFINKHLPFVWGFMYRWLHYLILPFRLFIAGFNCETTRVLVDEFKPDLIITTQTAASAVVAYLKSKGFYQNQFAIAFSDYHLHPYWLYRQADFYLANIAEQKQEMVKLGMSPQTIFVTGFNLKPAPAFDKQAARAKFHINHDQKVILLASGSLGLDLPLRLLRQLSENPNWHTLVVCGHNQKIYDQLSARFRQPNISMLAFYRPMDELYSISDIFLTKPGGLSTMEALRFNLPMIISSMLPGQEKLNLRFLRQRRLVMPRAENIVGQISREFLTGEFRAQLKTNPAVRMLFDVPDAAACLRRYLANTANLA